LFSRCVLEKEEKKKKPATHKTIVPIKKSK
jgi:hypothetical protein